MKSSRLDIASIRREQIVDAAVAVITEQGIQNLSLSEIEKKVGMSRGQLTYYFKAKEDIFLAVFDRLLLLMCQRHGDPEDHPFAKMSWLEVFRHLLAVVMKQPPEQPTFPVLQYTFLSQIGHRADFRERLAGLYALWRERGAEHLRRDLQERPSDRAVSPRAVSTLMQAILHGLAMQTTADPAVINPQEMIELCVDLLGNYLWPQGRPKQPEGGVPRRPEDEGRPLNSNGTNHDERNEP
jgi:AcrR family transcriptional regulator